MFTAPVVAATKATAERTTSRAVASDQEQPQDRSDVLRWEGEPAGWWRRNGWTFAIGASSGLLGGVGAYAIADIAALKLPRGRLEAIAAGAALAVGLGATLLTHKLRRRSDEVPALPTGSPRPLPAATAPTSSAPQPMLARGAMVGDGYGRWTETVTRTRTRADGSTETYTDWETRYVRWDLIIREQVGRREGYPTVQAAIDDLAEGDAAVLRRQGDRIVTYAANSGGRWSRLDRMTITDPATVAVVGPDGHQWLRDGTQPEFAESGRVPRTRVLTGDRDIGHYALRYRGDAGVKLRQPLTGVRGMSDLAGALGELRERPGDQAVVAVGGRFHVAEVAAGRVDRSQINDGLLTDEGAGNVLALEQQGQLWSPLGDWWVRARTPDPGR